ncbi:MotA/TolQ/ExbB proton channel family protein [Gammaproteobacteria bacterium]|jgi:biopolymer transport protein ExbB|nr:MotA/TolQ/ExbB proton channel family protein [Gammaproteobacteria bacterium]
MFYYLTLPFTSLLDFFDRGGPVIIVLFILAIIMTSLLIERLLFFISELNDLSDISHKEVILFKQENNWVFNKIKSKNISVINVAANKNLLLIQGLIALCPLLGLLGTVTGMIEVFDIMAITGTGNARAMASGIARATLPTMTGLFVSIVGLFLLTAIKASIDKATLDIKYAIEQI